MKIPKTRKRYCPKCNTHTTHKVSSVSTGAKRGSLRKGSKQRAARRGSGATGYGNHGRWSKPAIAKWKRKTKSTKKTNLKYTCQVCKKSTVHKKGKRTGKLKIE